MLSHEKYNDVKSTESHRLQLLSMLHKAVSDPAIELVTARLNSSDRGFLRIKSRLNRLINYRLRYLEIAATSPPLRWAWPSRVLKGKTFWGSKLYLPNKDLDAVFLWALTVCWGCYAPDGPELGLTRFFIKMLTPRDVFYDIGASYGFYTFLAAELITEGEIHAFEPNERVFYWLKRNCHYPHVILNNCALTNKSGQGMLFMPSNHSGAGSLRQELAVKRRLRRAQIPVQLTTLDEYVQKHRSPTIIKMDVEGAEQLVIEGGQKYLRENAPIIAMEVHGGQPFEHFTKLAVQSLVALGFQPYRLNPFGNVEKVDLQFLENLISKNDTLENMIFCRPNSGRI
ncbi:MAG: FkbM family methyltransferase [Dehalococcoidia bacterium]|nr:FkbM family methyltransferase [Dehalococcoidia bacterium]MDW8119902.1 FkbM family methyltransferase [Chloroflexota bacterium]